MYPLTDETARTLTTSAGNISYALRRSSRRRTMEISITPTADARVTAPRFVPLETIERFIHSRAEWIIQKVTQKQSEIEKFGRRQYETGDDFLFMGKPYPLIVDRSANCSTKLKFSGQEWLVRANPATSQAMIKKRLISWYRKEAGEIFGSRVFHYSRLMDLTPQKITVKTQKRLWGSCNPQGKSINLNWVLVMAPLSVIDYVVVHELCHLEVPNHSSRFWKKVVKFMPDYQQQEQWLKVHSSEMHLP